MTALSESNARKSLGILGGTFDPIHFGHLRAALEVYQGLKLDEIRLIPCQSPPHRAKPAANAFDRFQMVSLAIQDSVLKLDDREMKRGGESYSVDTLSSLRQEFPKISLCMILGVDAFLSLPSWHHWEKLLDLANIVVMHRVGWNFPEQGQMIDFLKEHRMPTDQTIQAFLYGKIVVQEISSLNIQASVIRSMIGSGRSPEFLLPEKVLKYIRLNQLYGYNSGDSNQEVTLP